MRARVEVLEERSTGRLLEARIGEGERPRPHQRVRAIATLAELEELQLAGVPCVADHGRVRMLPEIWRERARRVIG